MFGETNVKIFNTAVEPMASGNRTIKMSDKLFNINHLRKALENPANFVIVRNNVSKWAEETIIQNYMFTDVLTPEEGYEYTIVMTKYGRANSTIANRKIKLSFKGKGKNAEVKCTYYTS